MPTPKSLAVFCAASDGNSDAYIAATQNLARTLVKKNITIVYGGDNLGLMDVLANTALSEGGKIIGVIPRFLVERGLKREGLTETHIVDSMSERKSLFEKLSEGFILSVGGFGSLDEFFQMAVLNQVGINRKPVGIFNPENYYQTLLNFFEEMATQGFVRRDFLQSLLVESTPEKLLNAFENYRPSHAIRHTDTV